jgi:hypothetical protein
MACSHKDGRQPTFKLSDGNRVDELDCGTAREASTLQVGFPPRWTIRLVMPETAIETRARQPPLQLAQKQIFHLHIVAPPSGLVLHGAASFCPFASQ